MGYALANELASSGAKVTLVSGPVAALHVHPSVQLIRVQSAREMFDQCTGLFSSADGAVMAAAVADYRPAVPVKGKIRSASEKLVLELEPTPDISAHLGRIKKAHQFLVGFALETSHDLVQAKQKLIKKNLDFIVLNALDEPGAGFSTDTNKITIIDRQNKTTAFELKSKKEVAMDILMYLAEHIL